MLTDEGHVLDLTAKPLDEYVLTAAAVPTTLPLVCQGALSLATGRCWACDALAVVQEDMERELERRLAEWVADMQRELLWGRPGSGTPRGILTTLS